VEQRYFTTKETCRILNISPSGVYRLEKRGLLNAEFLGPNTKRYRLPITDEEWSCFRSLLKTTFNRSGKGTPRRKVAVTSGG